jgi:hypothetical protein
MGRQVVSFASIDLERAPAVERTFDRVGAVTIYGLDALQCARHQRTDFIEAWRAAICFEIGSEEFEKLCLARHRSR